jgi:hypothetical protein
MCTYCVLAMSGLVSHSISNQHEEVAASIGEATFGICHDPQLAMQRDKITHARIRSLRMSHLIDRSQSHQPPFRLACLHRKIIVPACAILAAVLAATRNGSLPSKCVLAFIPSRTLARARSRAQFTRTRSHHLLRAADDLVIHPAVDHNEYFNHTMSGRPCLIPMEPAVRHRLIAQIILTLSMFNTYLC